LLWVSQQRIFPSPHDEFLQDSVDDAALVGARAGPRRRVLRGRQDRVRRDVLNYCERDTWAMVKLVEALRELAHGK